MASQPLQVQTIIEEDQDEEATGADGRGEWIEMGQENGDKNNVVILTGTIKHGNEAGKNVEVKLDLKNNHFFKLRKKKEKASRRCLDVDAGPHITLFTILCIPFAFFISLGGSFYIGTWTWYNLNIYFSEEKTIFHKILICPILILTFPFTITLSSIAIGLFATFIQISWFFSMWWREIRDLEKGFFGWFCDKIGLAKCAPYETVVLNDESDLI